MIKIKIPRIPIESVDVRMPIVINLFTTNNFERSHRESQIWARLKRWELLPRILPEEGKTTISNFPKVVCLKP
jgi:hypothetical protein